jgi:hypothetical protein
MLHRPTPESHALLALAALRRHHPSRALARGLRHKGIAANLPEFASHKDKVRIRSHLRIECRRRLPEDRAETLLRLL